MNEDYRGNGADDGFDGLPSFGHRGPSGLPFSHETDPNNLPEGLQDVLRIFQEESQKVNIGDILPLLDGLVLPVAIVEGATRRVASAELLDLAMSTSTDERGDLKRMQIAIEDDERAARSSHIDPAETFSDQYTSNDFSFPAITFASTDLSAIAKKLGTVEKTDTPVYYRSDHTWQYEQEFPVYVHRGIESLGIRVATNPYTLKSEATLSMRINSEAPKGRHENIGLVDSILRVKEVNDEIFRYDFPDSDVDTRHKFKSRRGNAKGHFIKLVDGSEVLIELTADRIVFTHRTSSMQDQINEQLDGVEDKQTAEAVRDSLREEFSRKVKTQLDFVTTQFPAFIEHMSMIWSTQLPKTKLDLSKQPRTSVELGLFDEPKTAETEEEGGIPDCIKDPRQQDIYISTVKQKPQTTFEMVGGLDQQVKMMRNAIRKAMNPEFYEDVGLDPRSAVLLMGQPGTGKTMLAEAVANEVDGILLSAKGSDVMSMWAGEAEKNVGALFDLVEVLGKEGRKVVLFLDEIEAIASSRNSVHMMQHEKKVTAEFLNALNRKYPNAIIIAATNNPSDADPAVTRPGRFTTHIHIGNPNQEGRTQIFQKWVDYYKQRAKFEIFDELDIAQLAEVTEGLNGSDIRSVVENAIACEAENAFDEGRKMQPLGTLAMTGYVESHIKNSVQRFNSYLVADDNSDGYKQESGLPNQQGFILVPTQQS